MDPTWRTDPDANLIAVHLEDDYFDLAANQTALARPAADH